MSRLGFRKRRGFTLVEVSLATASGSMLLLAMIYTAQQIETVSDEIYNEVLVQTLARDLNVNLDNRIPQALAEAASAGDNISLAIDNPSAIVSLPRGSEWLAANALGALAAPAILSLSASTLPASAPSYTASSASKDQTMTFGTFTLRYLDSSTSGNDDGVLEYSKPDGTWAPMLELGSRSMFSLARFGFANWVPPSDSSTAWLRFSVDATTAQNLVLIETTLSKGTMLPFYLQSYYAPRSPNWTWQQNQVFNASSPPSGWPQPGTTAKDFRNQQGLFPVGVDKSLMTGAGFGAGDQVDVLNGAGTGSFGWVAFPNVDNNPTLDEELTNPGDTTFVDSQSGYTGYLTPGHWVKTETGLHGSTGTTAINNMASSQKLVDTMVYDTDNGQTGSSRQFHVTGFAQWTVTSVQGTPAPGVTTQSGSDYLQFVGYCDNLGNPMPPGYTPW